MTVLLCGARKVDAHRIGFEDEPKPSDWFAALTARGFSEHQEVLRAEAVAVLAEYATFRGLIFNDRQTPQ